MTLADIDPAKALYFLCWLASLVHVSRQARRLNERPVWMVLMIGVCAWPLGYLLWLLFWPGLVRHWLGGTTAVAPLRLFETEE